MTNPVVVAPLARSRVVFGGTPVVAASGLIQGGFVQNPFSAADQGLLASEPLYVDLINPAATSETATTEAIQPGDSFSFPANFSGQVSVNAASSGHRFAGIIVQPSPPSTPTPQAGTFPPAGPTTMTKTIPAYLYQEYDDDESCQAFVDAYNSIAQGYVDWFVETPLPIYTNQNIVGSLLDWIAAGLYGIKRPTLSSGLNRAIGPYDTWAFDTFAYNSYRFVGPKNVAITTDDIFKRILTWNLYRGDGNAFSVRWLKRRIMRFLLGANGAAPNVDNTSPVSVTLGPGIISIVISPSSSTVTGGAIYNRFGFNQVAYDSLKSKFTPGPSQLPNEPVLKEAIDSGVLQLPFQYEFVVTI